MSDRPADRPGLHCTCGAPAAVVVAVDGLLCDEEGTTRTYPMCAECEQMVLNHYVRAELVGRVSE